MKKMNLIKFQCPIEKESFLFFFTDAPIQLVQQWCKDVDELKSNDEIQIDSEYEYVIKQLTDTGFKVEDFKPTVIMF